MINLVSSGEAKLPFEDVPESFEASYAALANGRLLGDRTHPCVAYLLCGTDTLLLAAIVTAELCQPVYGV